MATRRKAPAIDRLPPGNLHITAIQRIASKHHNTPHMPRDVVRMVMEKAVAEFKRGAESKNNEHMREQLERDLGLDIADVLALVRRWPL